MAVSAGSHRPGACRILRGGAHCPRQGGARGASHDRVTRSGSRRAERRAAGRRAARAGGGPRVGAGADPARADARVAVRVLSRRGGDDGGRPRRAPPLGPDGPGVRRRAPVELRRLRSPDREMVFDINDFDETARGPLEWDVKRLAASIAIAGRELGLGAADAAATPCEAAVRSYRETMRRVRDDARPGALVRAARRRAHPQPRGDGVDKEKRRFKRRVARARAKDRLRACRSSPERVNGAPRIVSRPPLIFHSRTSGRATRRRGRCETCSRTTAHPPRRAADRSWNRYTHMARKVVGVGSVGVDVRGPADRSGNDDPLFLQFKEAGPSVLERYAGRGASSTTGSASSSASG